ncbi:hypothetical protein HDU76_000391 [Blyttiomyces sp. JEL0837]|nr:hypothetical protein HDU76_000391 [Blyttiomyces sp. JEL0837]
MFVNDPNRVTMNGVICNAPALVFTPDNWNVFQTLCCNGLGLKMGVIANGISTGLYLPYEVSPANDDNTVLCSGFIPVTRQIFMSAASHKQGDPHYLGYIWLVRAPAIGLYIQARLYSCNNGVSCTDAVHIQYEGTLSTFSLWKDANANVGPVFTQPVGQGRDEMTVYINPNNGKSDGYSVELRFTQGIKMTMTSNKWFGNSWYINTMFWAPPALQKKPGEPPVLGGILGNFDLNAANDFEYDPEWRIPGQTFQDLSDKNASTYDSIGRFGQKQRVYGTNPQNPGDILFYRCCTPEGWPPNPDKCLFPTKRSYEAGTSPYKLPPLRWYPRSYEVTAHYIKQTVFQSGERCDKLPPFHRKEYKPPFHALITDMSLRRRDSGLPSPTPEFMAIAEQVCTKAMASPQCESFTDPTTFIRACVGDARLTNTLDFTDSHKAQYFLNCAHTITGIQSNLGFMDPDSTASLGRRGSESLESVDLRYQLYGRAGINGALLSVLKNALQTSDDMGLHDNNCVGNCSGRGTCSVNGCRCKDGWTGVMCDISISELHDAAGVTSAKGPQY